MFTAFRGGGTATICCVFALQHVSSQAYTTLPPEWFLPARLQLTFSSYTVNMTSQMQNLEKQATQAQHSQVGKKNQLNQMAAYLCCQ